jgi:hypothetical protein
MRNKKRENAEPTKWFFSSSKTKRRIPKSPKTDSTQLLKIR